jgi:hypothetical protein
LSSGAMRSWSMAGLCGDSSELQTFSSASSSIRNVNSESMSVWGEGIPGAEEGENTELIIEKNADSICNE